MGNESSKSLRNTKEKHGELQQINQRIEDAKKIFNL